MGIRFDGTTGKKGRMYFSFCEECGTLDELRARTATQAVLDSLAKGLIIVENMETLCPQCAKTAAARFRAAPRTHLARCWICGRVDKSAVVSPTIAFLAFTALGWRIGEDMETYCPRCISQFTLALDGHGLLPQGANKE